MPSESKSTKAVVESVVKHCVGFVDDDLVSTAVRSVERGHDRQKFANRLNGIVDSSQAARLADKILAACADLQKSGKLSSSKDRKRKHKDADEAPAAKNSTNDATEDGGQKEVKKKKKKFEEVKKEPISEAEQFDTYEPTNEQSPGQISAEKIKEILENAKREAMQRKAVLSSAMADNAAAQSSIPAVELPPGQDRPAAAAGGTATAQAEVVPLMSLNVGAGTPQQAPTGPPTERQLRQQDVDKARRMMELQSRIQMQLSATGLAKDMSNAAQQSKHQESTADKAQPVIIDARGQIIDAKTGLPVELKGQVPTLKANIRAQKREQFKQTLQERAPPEEITDSKFFDPRVGVHSTHSRTKKQFRFHEPGKFQKLAQQQRAKAQLERLQADIAQAAKRTGIASAARLATIVPKIESAEETDVQIEWWDSAILNETSYDSIPEEGMDERICQNFEIISRLIEHPMQLDPSLTSKETEIPVYLTKKERKKIRRQNRKEAQKEEQEKYRLGLIPAPEPKVKLANLMRVLGADAVQDPTKIEAHVRAQVAKRLKQHEDANRARKLTDEQRKEKKRKRLDEDTSQGVHVSVYRLRDLSNPQNKFKIEHNAKQRFLSGFVVLFKDCNVLVVEGGPKNQKKFRHLLMNRLNWKSDKKSKDQAQEQSEDRPDACCLVWEGTVKQRAFGEMKFKSCPTESFAHEQFKKFGVPQYWDYAYSTSILGSELE